MEATTLPMSNSASQHNGLSDEKDSTILTEDVHATAAATLAASKLENEVYAEVDKEPEIHWRTWVAVIALLLLNYVQVVCLTGPAAILNYIGADLNGADNQAWVQNSISLVQAVGGPIISFGSDSFQARKIFLITPCILSFVGCAIAPGASSIYRVIGAQILIGCGFATVPLAYCIPSEILPRRWRPLVQSAAQISAALGATTGPIVAGALTRKSAHMGWRHFYWFQMAIWGMTVVTMYLGYNPPKRHTALENVPLKQKIKALDLPGMGLLTAGLTLLLTGLSLGGSPWPWKTARVLAPLSAGIVLLVGFGVYEWRGTSQGVLHHRLFREGGRTFPICVALIFIEAILLFSHIVFVPVMVEMLYESDPLLGTLRISVYWLGAGISAFVFGYWATKRRTIRSPSFTGWALFTAGIGELCHPLVISRILVATGRLLWLRQRYLPPGRRTSLAGLASVQPGAGARMLGFDALAGFGFGCPLVMIVTGVQLAIPHELIATGTAVITSSRAVAAATFTAIYAAILNSGLGKHLAPDVAKGALQAGLPESSLVSFIPAFLGKDAVALSQVVGVSPAVIASAAEGLKQAFADSLRIIYVVAAPFGALACLLSLFLPDLSASMHWKVEAPVEHLEAKRDVGRV